MKPNKHNKFSIDCDILREIELLRLQSSIRVTYSDSKLRDEVVGIIAELLASNVKCYRYYVTFGRIIVFSEVEDLGRECSYTKFDIKIVDGVATCVLHNYTTHPNHRLELGCFSVACPDPDTDPIDEIVKLIEAVKLKPLSTSIL